MKILILTNNLGGLISFRMELLERLKDDNYEVVVSAPIDDLSLAQLNMIGVGYVPTKINRRGTNPLKDGRLIIEYINLLKKIHPDAVLSYTIKPNLYGGIACRICGTPQIANITGLGTAVESQGLIRKIVFILYRIGLKSAKYVFFQNEGNKKFCINHNLVNKNAQIALIPGSGVNIEHFILYPYPSDEAPIKFLYIGRIMEAKGSRELFETAHNIKKIFTNVEFHIVGEVEAEFKQEFDTLINDGSITFHGEQSDVRPYIAKSHCLIHPSYHEGMSNVILEACSMGRPIITTNVSGCREPVDNGISGFIVNPKDAKDLTEKVIMFIHLPLYKKRDMGIKAHLKVKKGFDRAIVIDAYLKAIKNV